MTLAAQINSLASSIGADIKDLRTKQGTLTSLSTTAKASLVAAINELYSMLGNAGVQINDTAGDGNTTETWSADKIFDTIEAAKLAVKNDLVAGAATTLDTLNELAAALGNDPNFATTLATEMGKRVRFDAAQTLSAAEKLQACNNIGIGDPETDFAATYATAKA